MTTPISGVTTYAATPTNTTASTSSDPTTTGTTKSSGLALDSQAFLQLLVAQLQYQDPTNPTDTSAFMSQTATLSQVQTMDSMSTTLATLLTQQQAQSATEMLGRNVTYVDATGVQHTGTVNSVSLLAGGPTLHIDSASVPLSSVVGVTQPQAATTTGSA